MTTKTDLDHSRQLLEHLGFEQVPQMLPELVEEGVRDELALLPFLDLICAVYDALFTLRVFVPSW